MAHGRVIAVDGPVASGKGTLACRLAAHYRLNFLDTGLLYRAVASRVLAAGGDPNDPAAAATAAAALTPDDTKRADLRDEQVGQAASIVAAHQSVRAALLDYQRSVGRVPPGAVLDGRDIGTVVFPDAEAKLYMTASLEVRARRRVKQLREKGNKAIESRVLAEMKERDARDGSRAVAPLRPADDALVIDTTDLDPDEVFHQAVRFIDSKGG
ncbi:MAG: (d)CMP kinase [Alphaproteobacteria bacterium]|nr:(d)CMP kinase [Alphaproteobacteria bacterium]